MSIRQPGGKSEPRCPSPYRAASLVALALLSGCTVGPNYHRPAAPVPPAYPGSIQPISTAADSLGDERWWDLFHDLVLQEHIRKALRANPDVAIAAARVELVRAQIEGLRASYSPEVNVAANETLQRISPIGLPRNRTTGNPAGSATILGAQASWEIDFWGKYRRANEAARATLLSSQAAQQAVDATLVSDVASAYFDLLSLDEQHRLAAQYVALRQAALDLVTAREIQGVSSLEEVRRAEAHLDDAREQLEPIAQRITEREDEMRTLEGETAGPIARAQTLWAEALPDPGPGIPSTLLERRPDIRSAEQDLIAANANIGVAESAYFPNISLTAAGGLESTAFHNLFTSQASTWLLSPQVNLPIFNFYRIRANVNQAKAEDEALVSNYRGTVIAAFRDVADALAYRQSAQQLETEQKRLASHNADAAHLTHRRLEEGVSSALEAIDADGATLSAQSTQARFRGDQLISVVHLYRALGGGWQP